MNNACSLLAGLGLGAGLMYALDPDVGRRRRALARDKAVGLAHQTQHAVDVVRNDVRNRARGLAAGDLSVLVGGKRAVTNPLRGGWSPAGRALLSGLGTGLFLYGLTQEFPTACILGTVGLAMIGEGVTNAGVADITQAAGTVAERTRAVAQAVRGAAPQTANA